MPKTWVSEVMQKYGRQINEECKAATAGLPRGKKAAVFHACVGEKLKRLIAEERGKMLNMA